MQRRWALSVAMVLALASCGRDTPTTPSLHSLSGAVVLTGYLVDASSHFVGTRIDADADGVAVDLLYGDQVVRSTTTRHGAYRFDGLQNGGYVARSRVIGTVDDETATLTIAGADVVSRDTLRLASVGDITPVPNPRAPLSDLYFALADSVTVTVRVLDLAGHTVRHLYAGPLSAGLHAVRWDGRDDAAQPVTQTAAWAIVEAPGDTRAQLVFY